jgi:hypothetical protein
MMTTLAVRAFSMLQRLIPLVVLLAWAAAAPPALAAGSYAAAVLAVEPPAWAIRQEAVIPLRPGMDLQAGDVVKTGNGARAHLELADLSIVKLGENAVFKLEQLEWQSRGRGGLLRGALSVLQGAFRFTTTTHDSVYSRELSINFGRAITTGIRGTDIWGKSDATQDLVCLLEGRISVQSPGAPETTMDRSNTFYVVPAGQAPKPVVPVPQEKLVTWVPQTEVKQGRGVMAKDGQWQAVLISVSDPGAALTESLDLQQEGYPVEVQEMRIGGKTVHRVVAGGFATRDDANAFGARLRGHGNITKPWTMSAPK